LKPGFVALLLEFNAQAFFSMMFAVTLLYDATVAGLTSFPLIPVVIMVAASL